MEEQEETEILEEFTGTFLTEDNAQFLSIGETPEEEQMIEEIEEGRVIGFAPASLSAVGEEELESAGYAEGKASAAPLKPGRYRLISTSVIANCDEVWTSSSAIHARVRYIEYVDSDGNVKSSFILFKGAKDGNRQYWRCGNRSETRGRSLFFQFNYKENIIFWLWRTWRYL